MPKMMTDRQIADLLSCSRATVWRMVNDGRLPQPMRLGGLTRWPLDGVRAALGV